MLWRAIQTLTTPVDAVLAKIPTHYLGQIPIPSSLRVTFYGVRGDGQVLLNWSFPNHTLSLQLFLLLRLKKCFFGIFGITAFLFYIRRDQNERLEREIWQVQY
ncbi:hypothetical protein COT52_02285 [candidate division WWE3 bacterium CG08_land_8_20_14_0_20_43_13]|uniref:Uncharacterized protein n=1 Tax=candidate division WWE3 bacterium CG08_land_8_20_14_0_20_43_13 TaxID=1975087 RepID=A0A2H0X970_UNCKA|nr:MAG: hypothetical protein COT52_02285 [candidate division WWE3 bacterium CG08_land_8_20_14_0_20_43_13]